MTLASFRRLRAAAGWTAYVVAMVALFVWLDFPTDRLQARLLAEASRQTGLSLHADAWTPEWPLGLAWQDLSVTGPGLPRFGAERVAVEAEVWPLLEGRLILHVTAQVAGRAAEPGGTIAAKVSLDSWSAQGAGSLVGVVERLKPSSLSLPHVSQGTLQASFEHRWTTLQGPLGWLNGQGTWQIDGTGLVLDQLPLGPLTLPPLTIASASGRIHCTDGSCRIQALHADGPDGTITGEGVLTLNAPLSDSALILSLFLTVTDSFKQRFPLAAALPGTPGAPVKLTVTGPLSKLQPSL